MATTLKDIAKKLGLSEATVSLALNNNSLVSEKTKKRVHETAKELKYSPNMIAKGLATSKSNTIGVIVPDINIVFYANILRELDEIVNRKGYSLIVAMSNDDPDIEEGIVKSFIAKRIEGILAVPTNRSTKSLESYRRALKEQNIPLVYITSLYMIDGIRYVMGDIEDGTYMLLNHLIELGHKKIVFIGGNKEVPTTLLRREAYKRALTEHGIPIEEKNLIECDAIHYDCAVLATEELIKKRRDFTAICAMNDEMALGVVNTLHRANIRVPEDVSVVGYDNTIFSNVSMVGITSMDSDISGTCRQAVDMLIQIMQGEEPEESRIMVKPRMVPRRSTARIK